MAFDAKTAVFDDEQPKKFDSKSAVGENKPKEEPGWFMPGSKSEALARGFSQGATFGFGDEIQAGLRSVPELFQKGGLKKYLDSYKTLRDEERVAAEEAARANPGSYIAGNVVAALPQAGNVMNVARGAGAIRGSQLAGKMVSGGATGATYGAVHGAGQAETVGDIPVEAAKTAAISGTIGAVAPGAGAVAQKVMGGPNVIKRTAQNYKDLKPGVTAQVGPVTLGGAGGLAAGNLGGLVGVPGSIAPEDWTTDPYSAAAKSLAWTLGGMTGGKAIKEAGRLGGAVQKTMRGEGGAPTAGGNAVPPRPSGGADGAARPDVIPEDRPFGVGREDMVDVPVRQVGDEVPTPFSRMADYLKEAQNSGNPAVQKAAAQAESAVGDFADDVAKRKAAMDLQSSKVGRAVGNAESPVREAPPGTMGMMGREVRENTGSYGSMTPKAQASGDDMWEKLRDPRAYQQGKMKQAEEIMKSDPVLGQLQQAHRYHKGSTYGEGDLAAMQELQEMAARARTMDAAGIKKMWSEWDRNNPLSQNAGAFDREIRQNYIQQAIDEFSKLIK